MGKNIIINMENNGSKLDVPIVERYFSDSTTLSFEEIMDSLLKEAIEHYVNSSYHDEQVNVATSEVGVA